MDPEGVANEIRSRLAANDPVALEMIWAEYASDLLGYLAGLHCSWHDAKDILQEVFVTIAKKRASVATAQWQYSSPPLDRPVPEADFLAGLADSPALRKLIAVEAAHPEKVAMQMTGHNMRSVFERYSIVSEGDLFAPAAKLAEAAGIISKEPIALQLRYLQTLTEIGVEKNTTVVFPVPIDILKNWIQSKT